MVFQKRTTQSQHALTTSGTQPKVQDLSEVAMGMRSVCLGSLDPTLTLRSCSIVKHFIFDYAAKKCDYSRENVHIDALLTLASLAAAFLPNTP